MRNIIIIQTSPCIVQHYQAHFLCQPKTSSFQKRPPNVGLSMPQFLWYLTRYGATLFLVTSFLIIVIKCHYQSKTWIGWKSNFEFHFLRYLVRTFKRTYFFLFILTVISHQFTLCINPKSFKIYFNLYCWC